MDLKSFFKQKSKDYAPKWGVSSPFVEVLKAPGRKMSTGMRTTFDFEQFKFIITYIESGRAAYAKQTLWLSVSLDDSMILPYSIYDVLAFCEPENFKSYTYTYVDSEDLMEKCFSEIDELITRIAPKFKELLSDGVSKNRFISNQKQTINNYFGDKVIESSEMVGGAADKLIAMMLENFYEAQIEAAVIGTQALFYSGNGEKALKKLKKAKSRTLYQENLMKFIENGGKATVLTKTGSETLPGVGYTRQKKTTLKQVGTICLCALFVLPVAIALIFGMYILLVNIIFKDSLLLLGVKENIVSLSVPATFFALPIVLYISDKIQQKRNKRNKKENINEGTIVSDKYGKKFMKFLSLGVEALVVFYMFICVFSTVSFEENVVKYSEADYPLSHQEIEYSAIEEVCIVQGYYVGEKKVEESYIAIKTVSGQIIDLYNSSFLSVKDFIPQSSFINERGIIIKIYKSDRDLV